ncbi:MAG: type II toxin-antitoxin system VapC family toxin, partial [Thermoanaerobaculales bacterium]|nr:type II toxin-antitoxin system VapC family toxin [Thermoanaerobaculales bacterium]
MMLKWVLPPENEPNAQEALAVLDQFVAGDIVLAVPSLWYFEVGNTVARLVPQEAGEYLKQLRRLGITEAEIDPSVEDTALGYVQRFGVPPISWTPRIARLCFDDLSCESPR